MLKFLKMLYTFIKSKFIKFLIEVWEGENDRLIRACYRCANEVVQNVENMANYVVENRESDSTILMAHLEVTYGYILNTKDIDGIKRDKSKGKSDLAHRLIMLRMEEERKDYKKSIINFCIEAAVNRFFK